LKRFFVWDAINMSRREAQPYQAHSCSDAAMRFVHQDIESFFGNMFSKNGKTIPGLISDGHPVFVEDPEGKLHIFRIVQAEANPTFDSIPAQREDYIIFDAHRKNKKTKPLSYKFKNQDIECNDFDERYYVVDSARGINKISD